MDAGQLMSESQGRRRCGAVIGSALVALIALGGLACQRRSAKAISADSRPSSEVEPQSPARVEGSGYLFTPAEKAAVDDFLGRHADLRVATDSDRRGTKGGDGDVRGLYGVYHPYFVRGDVNDDGILDFVLAFVHRGSGRATPWFSIVVFTGRGRDAGYNPGTFLERNVSLARGDLSIDRDAVLITPDLSDEAVRRYRWDPVHRSYVFVRDGEEEDETPLATRT
jgi:hypothetical protein